ncbi:restriction endonuclease subunit S [Campylobacter sp. JMF_06 NA1]|uniref:restriction endonuclease subunit S n=1 Tax=Campylobacter sp. JMF_06 NA1 TaxID=2983823 RepID=UPI0022E9FF05|nr:restriction endonuclease subunit S [Campylobacter sp. JMF_06 NA1]MDA3077576.1 restriction endonuclease subunit S [Campylobacter sp. JMF_06 NA1]
MTNKTALDEIAEFNAKISTLKSQREKLLSNLEKLLKTKPKNSDKIKHIIAKIKTKIKSYRTITPLNTDLNFNPPFEIPNSWVWVKLGEICEIVRGGSPRPIENYLTNSENGFNWIKIGDSDIGGKYIKKTAQKITKDGLYKTRFVKAGSLLLTNSMSFGRPYILQINGCIHDGWLVLSKFENLTIIDYLFYLLTCNYVQKSFRETVSGAVVKNLSTEKVQGTIIPLPPKNEQEFIASELEKLLSLCKNL